MKKFTWIAFAVISLLAILVLCCKNTFGTDATVSGDGITVGDTLNISVSTDEHLQIFKVDDSNSQKRTISSDAFKIGESGDGLIFYLYGNAQSGQTLAPKTVSVTSSDGINGTVTLDIDCYNWELTLVACETADLTTEAAILEDAVLIGYANVDMLFTNDIKFTLSPKGLTKKGNVALAIERKNDWAIPDGYVATAGIYDITSMNAILGGADNDESLSTVLADYSTATPTDTFIATSNADSYFTQENAIYTANGSDIAPGTYLFQIEFKKENENRRYVWNDTIIILPGKTTDSINQISGSTNEYTTRITIPNLIGEKPAAPKDLTVTYKEDEDKDSSGYYSVKLDWDGSDAVTETNFALQIMELASDATVDSAISTDDDWDVLWAAAANQYEFNYLNDIRTEERFYKSGSLFANNSTITVYFELGKRYLLRLYSENNAGYSESAAYATIEPDSKGNNYTLINRYRVTYHLQGGTWKSSAEFTQDQIAYWGQSDNDYSVIHPIGISDGSGGTTGDADHPYLYNTPAKWLYWAESLAGDKYPYDSAAPYTPNPYSDYQNLDLYAVYTREGSVEVYNDRTYDILPSYVAGFGIEAGSVLKNDVNDFSKASVSETPKTTTVSLTLPAAEEDGDPTWLYDKVIFEITYGGRTYFANEQVGQTRGTANTFTIDLTNFPTGYTYNCKLTAHYQRTIVSYPFAVSIKD